MWERSKYFVHTIQIKNITNAYRLKGIIYNWSLYLAIRW